MAIELRKMDVDDLPVFRECCTRRMSQTGMNIRWTEWRRWKSRTARFAGFTTLLWSAGKAHRVLPVLYLRGQRRAMGGLSGDGRFLQH